jgi:hypothetical protein
MLLLTCIQLQAKAQEVKVSGNFLADSIKIGEPVAYSFTARYPQHLTILFPDSTYSFFPFEFHKKVFFSTKTSNGISYDSTIYYLTSFELDKIQRLNLPAFIVSVRDCTEVAANPDSVFLISSVEIPPDSLNAQNLPLKTDTAYEDVHHQFNYFIILIILTTLAILSVVIWFTFGKRIIKYYKVKRFIKKHQEFISTYTQSVEQLNSTASSEKTEQTVLLWKKHMEYLDRKPYTKLTTKETVLVTPNDTLKESLKNIDGAIYGNNQNVTNALMYLRQFSENQFQKRLAEVKNG